MEKGKLKYNITGRNSSRLALCDPNDFLDKEG